MHCISFRISILTFCFFAYFLNKNSWAYKAVLSIGCLQRKRHYWKLDSNAITLYKDESTSRYYKVCFNTLLFCRDLYENVDSYHYVCINSTSFSFSLIPSQGSRSPPRSTPRSPRGVESPCWTFLLTRCPIGLDRELDTVAPGALLSCQRHCSVDSWQSPDAQYGADILPTWRMTSG